MASTITAGNATNGLGLSSDNTGILQIKTGAGAGTAALTLNAAQNAIFAGVVTSPTGALYPLVNGTAQNSTSGTLIDFTGIPATAKRITVLLNGISVSGTSRPILQLGITSGIDAINYIGASTSLSNGNQTTYSTGFTINSSGTPSAADVFYGAIVLSNLTGNIWVCAGNLGTTSMGGVKTLSAVLDRVRITTINGTDTFDAGSINVMWE